MHWNQKPIWGSSCIGQVWLILRWTSLGFDGFVRLCYSIELDMLILNMSFFIPHLIQHEA